MRDRRSDDEARKIWKEMGKVYPNPGVYCHRQLVISGLELL